MPKHVRHNLIRSLRCVHDSLLDFKSLEAVNAEEKEILDGVEDTINAARKSVWEISESLEARVPEGPIPPLDESAELFSWVNHDNRIKTQRKRERLEAQLAKAKAQLEALP